MSDFRSSKTALVLAFLIVFPHEQGFVWCKVIFLSVVAPPLQGVSGQLPPQGRVLLQDVCDALWTPILPPLLASHSWERSVVALVRRPKLARGLKV